MTIENMTLEQMAGQRLMVGFKGTRINQKIRDLIAKIKVGGVILFSYNILYIKVEAQASYERGEYVSDIQAYHHI